LKACAYVAWPSAAQLRASDTVLRVCAGAAQNPLHHQCWWLPRLLLESRYQNALQIRRASGKEASVLAELWNVVD